MKEFISMHKALTYLSLVRHQLQKLLEGDFGSGKRVK